jgi:hypothetical protein
MKRKIHTSKVLLIDILLTTADLAGCADSDSDDAWYAAPLDIVTQAKTPRMANPSQ